MKRKPLLITNFEACSVMLMASWTLGLAGAAYTHNAARPVHATSRSDVSAPVRETDPNADGHLTREAAPGTPSAPTRLDPVDSQKDRHTSPGEPTQAVQQ